MAEVLELAQLLQDDGVAEVDVRRGRIEAELDAQRPALLRRRGQPRRQAARRAATRRRFAPGRPPGTRDRNRRMASGPMLEFLPPERSPGMRAPPARNAPAAGRPPPSPSAPRRHERRRSARHPASPVDAEPLPADPFEPPPPAGRPKLRKRRLLLTVIPLVAARDRLDDLRDDDGARARAAEPRDRAASSRPPATRCCRTASAGRSGCSRATATASSSPTTDISPFMRNAIISIEDERFYENAGVDVRGIGRAFFQDVVKGGSRQGGSTITQQFVKNALEAQDERTVFQKLRESALAYHLTRHWSKNKILTAVPELDLLRQRRLRDRVGRARRTSAPTPTTRAAGRPGAAVRQGARPPPRRRCSPASSPTRAPSTRSPIPRPPRAGATSCWRRCSSRARSRAPSTRTPRSRRCPANIDPPSVDTKAPYFTTWVSQQLVEQFGARRAFEGGLRVRTTLDLDLQNAAAARDRQLAAQPRRPGGRAWSRSTTATGEVRALVNSTNYRDRPFNLATQGQRQPGSTFKPFILAEAMKQGYGLGSVWPSRKREFDVPGTGGQEKFIVNNFDDSYSGARDLGSALTFSDNSVFAAAGIATGTKRIARLIERMGIRTPVSTNPAMTLGGLQAGVSSLDWAHAYETFATGGKRVWGTLGAPDRRARSGIRERALDRDGPADRPQPREDQARPVARASRR